MRIWPQALVEYAQPAINSGVIWLPVLTHRLPVGGVDRSHLRSVLTVVG